VPTMAPTAPAALPGTSDGENGGASPRVTPKPGLPPTWTPQPTALPATPLPSPVPQGAGQQPSGTYVVQRGDTLAEIAQRFGVSLTDLVRLNDIQDIDRIEVGQVLVIPTP
jgi:LysM repeat protein